MLYMNDLSTLLPDEEINKSSDVIGQIPLVIPVIDEKIVVTKKTVETGKVRITKKRIEQEGTLQVPLTKEVVQVERVPVNRFVDTVPQIRYEGEVMIVPVVEEVAVVEKRIRLVEELRITKQQVQTQESQQITLLKEEVTVERVASDHINPLSD